MSEGRMYEKYKDLSMHPICNCGIAIGLVNDNIKEWNITMTAPKDTSYKGGYFFLNVHFPDNYPNKPPEVCFITLIYHLNINPKAPKFEGDEFDKLGHVSISTLN